MKIQPQLSVNHTNSFQCTNFLAAIFKQLVSSSLATCYNREYTILFKKLKFEFVQ
jgi:hypothetical protein